MDLLNQLFLPTSIWLQSWPAEFLALMQGITFLGNTEFYLLFMPALFWCIHPSLGLRMGFLLLISGSMNSILKLSFRSPRPYWISPEITGAVPANSYSFPSGHAQNAAGIWGLLALSINGPGRKLLSVLGILLIGISRVFLGVHYLHDVLVGWAAGGLLLGGFLHSEDRVRGWFQESSLPKKIGIMTLCLLVVLLAAGSLFSPLDAPGIPGEWLENSRQSLTPGNFDDMLTSLGALYGLGIGLSLLAPKGVYQAQGTPAQRILRYPVGLLGVVLLWGGLGSIFPEDGTLCSMSLRLFRYSLIGLWISLGAPLLFVKLKLARLENPPAHL